MPTPDDRPETVDTPEWLTIGEAAQALDVSAKTVRRRIKDGSLPATKRHDPEVGQARWFIAAEDLPRAPGTTGAMIPASVLDRLDELHREIADQRARAEKAETVATFQAERREALEAERDRARAEAEELRRALEAERSRRWWQPRAR